MVPATQSQCAGCAGLSAWGLSYEILARFMSSTSTTCADALVVPAMAYLPRQGAQLRPGRAKGLERCCHIACSVPPRPHTRVASTVRVASSNQQQGSTQDSLEDIMDVLKDAFGAAASQAGTAQPRHLQHSEASTHSGFANSSRRAISRSRQESNEGSSSSKRASKPEDTPKLAAEGPGSSNGREAASSPAPSFKKRKGPFVDLISALEEDMMQPAQHRISNSSNSTRSSSTSGPANNHVSIAASNGISRASATSGTSTAKRTTRGIRGRHSPEDAADLQQGQQSVQQLQQQPPSQQSHQHQQQQPQKDPEWLQHPLVLGNSKKQYTPVYKGGLALPGGPAWSSLRRHIVAAGNTEGLPTLDCIVLVEGDQDQRAVARAVNAPVSKQVQGMWCQQ
eukprot:GHUV01015992.1.p1 GENE.GHUV01015992.1~~GHUV01015992.1.p1  ORF type:complete len:395 (+),score=115.46 GHUV01015992.1:409-1593(+)